MEKNKIRILCTKELNTQLYQTAANSDIEIITVPFIQTEAADIEAVINETIDVGKQKTAVIFTSSNAVEAVVRILKDRKPAWKVFCIGPATADLVERHFGVEQVAATAFYGSELAQKIIDHKVSEAVFFCGNMRRDELPAILSAASISLKEIIVYNTIQTPYKITSAFDGCVFFSPSAVTSFFSVNNDDYISEFFSIGTTTANVIKQYTNKEIITGNETAGKQLIETVLHYYNSRKRNSLAE